MPQVYRAIRPMFTHGQWRIFPDDIVEVLTGPEKGIRGKVLTVIKDKRRPELIVEGVNMRKKKVYIGVKEEEFFVVTMEAPVHYSNVMLVDPVSKQPVRTLFRYLPDGTRVRIGLGGNASKEVIPIPVQPDKMATKYGLCGAKDTPQEEVLRVTYDPTAPFPFRPQTKRPSGLPMPEEAEASTSAAQPANKGVWVTPAWLGAPRTAQPQELASATGALRRFSSTAAQRSHHSSWLSGGSCPSLFQWIVERQQWPPQEA